MLVTNFFDCLHHFLPGMYRSHVDSGTKIHWDFCVVLLHRFVESFYIGTGVAENIANLWRFLYSFRLLL